MPSRDMNQGGISREDQGKTYTQRIMKQKAKSIRIGTVTTFQSHTKMQEYDSHEKPKISQL